LDQLLCFRSIYPKENEIKLLVNKLSDLGMRSFCQALDSIVKGELKCEKIEHFLLKLLAYPTDLKRKAETMA